MGRVSRYKRVKASDPFYKGPRKKDQRDVDRRPENEDDQPVPKSLVRLMRSMEEMGGKGADRQTGTTPERKAAASRSGKPISGETLTAGKRNTDRDGEKKEGPMFERRKGESLKEYFNRIDVEANTHIMESYRANRKKSDRRKRYLEERRRKLKSRRRGAGEKEVLEREEEEGEGEDAQLTRTKPPMDFSDLKDEVLFGEVVSAPPRLNVRPRGAGKRGTKGPSRLLLHNKLSGAQTSTSDLKTVKPAETVGLKRKQDLEEEREKAIEVYRLSKKSRLSRTKL